MRGHGGPQRVREGWCWTGTRTLATSRSPGTAVEFALAVMEKLLGPRAAFPSHLRGRGGRAVERAEEVDGIDGCALCGSRKVSLLPNGLGGLKDIGPQKYCSYATTATKPSFVG